VLLEFLDKMMLLLLLILLLPLTPFVDICPCSFGGSTRQGRTGRSMLLACAPSFIRITITADHI
jgi:hypothetical protein